MTKKGTIQLKDIAKEADVSIALVSYVLNGKYPNRIKKETAKKILEVAKRLKYKPNHLAKGLRTQSSGTIGLIVADLSNPFSAKIARIIEDQVSKHGYIVLIASTDEKTDKFSDAIDTFISRGIDGMLIIPTQNGESEIDKIIENNIPYVLIDRYFPEKEFNFIANDNYYSTHAVTTNLVSQGKKNIGLINLKSQYHHLNERTRGYLEACHALKIETSNTVKEVDFNNLKSNIHQALDELIDEIPAIDAIIFTTNILTLYGLTYAVINRDRIPADIKFVGYDEEDFYDLFPYKVSYYKQPLTAMSKQAIEQLIKEIQHPGQAKIHQFFRGELID